MPECSLGDAPPLGCDLSRCSKWPTTNEWSSYDIYTLLSLSRCKRFVTSKRDSIVFAVSNKSNGWNPAFQVTKSPTSILGLSINRGLAGDGVQYLRNWTGRLCLRDRIPGQGVIGLRRKVKRKTALTPCRRRSSTRCPGRSPVGIASTHQARGCSRPLRRRPLVLCTTSGKAGVTVRPRSRVHIRSFPT